jgi:hypothetical protein
MVEIRRVHTLHHLVPVDLTFALLILEKAAVQASVQTENETKGAQLPNTWRVIRYPIGMRWYGLVQLRRGKYAVRYWHYSRSLPCSKTARLDIWESDKFIGAVVFAWGANRHLVGEYKLKMTECAELCRIALAKHVTPVSKIMSIACRATEIQISVAAR